MEYIYYDDEPSSDDDAQLSGGIRQSPFLQHGNNASSTPYHVAETMAIASAGKIKIPKSIKKIGKSVGKAVYNEVKPIVVQQGRQMLKEGINSLLNSQEPAVEGSGRKRGRPKKMVEQEGGKIHLGKALKAIGKSPITKQIQNELIQQGVQQGIAYATGAGMYPAQMECGTTGGKFKIGKAIGKIAKNPIVKQIGQEALHQGIQLGVEGLMAGAGKSRSGRGAIVKKIMAEKGLSLPMASKYVKEHNLY